jgi:hypothetical protein
MPQGHERDDRETLGPGDAITTADYRATEGPHGRCVLTAA